MRIKHYFNVFLIDLFKDISQRHDTVMSDPRLLWIAKYCALSITSSSLDETDCYQCLQSSKDLMQLFDQTSNAFLFVVVYHDPSVRFLENYLIAEANIGCIKRISDSFLMETTGICV